MCPGDVNDGSRRRSATATWSCPDMTRSGVRRPVVLLLATLAALTATVALAGAHAVLEESEPAADSTVSSPPTEVVMRFSEPLIEAASHATVTAPDGEKFSEVEIDADAQEMRVALASDASGVYAVDWVTVSPIDGHTWEGSFEFRVDRGEPDATEREPVDPPDAESPPVPDPPAERGPERPDEERGVEAREPAPGRPSGLRLLAGGGRAMEYLGWLAVLGWLTLGALARSVQLDWVPRRLLPWVTLAAAGAVLTVLAELLQAGGGSLAAGVAALAPTSAGWVRAGRVGVAILAFGIVVGATAGTNGTIPQRGSRVLVTLLTLTALVLLAASGHAASTGLSLAVGAAHLATAGVWAGTIVAMAVDRPPGGWRSEPGRDLVREFAPYGLTMFAATVLFGVVRAVQELSRVSDLWTSTYGQLLALKVLLVLAMVPLSWLAWRRATPLPRTESGLAVGAVVLAAGLAVLGPPAPGAEERSVPEGLPQAERDDAGNTEPVEVGLPQPNDLTLSGDAGATVVGLTLRPGQPGDNQVFAYLVPRGGIDEAGTLEATLTVADGEPIAMEPCGEGCRTARVRLDGAEHLEVAVRDGDQKHAATFELPQLPATDGADLLDRAEQRMNQLRTLRYDEVFGPHEPPTLSTWEIVAPDRLYGVVTRGDEDHREILRIEDRRWRRDGPDQPWEGGDPGGSRVTANRFIWEEEGRTAIRILGRDTVEGVDTQIVSFFVAASEQLPVWYRVWVDNDDLVRQAEMRTQGHFMDHRYYDFDEDIRIEAPG